MCSTLNFLKLYETEAGFVCPAALVTCLPQINSQFQQGQQQCAAEFFQEFCRVLGHTANQYQTENLIPASCNLSFLRSFLFELQSEIICSTCQNVTSNSTMETTLATNVPYQGMYLLSPQRAGGTVPQNCSKGWYFSITENCKTAKNMPK